VPTGYAQRGPAEGRVAEWAAQQQQLHATIFRVRGRQLRQGMRLLDLGCGNGAVVEAYRWAGLDAHGCDLEPPEGAEFLWPIEREPYRLPFPDCSFDVVVSQTVMEHVQNWDETLLEVARVLKPDGYTLHLFPARLRPIEAHVLIPLAGVMQQTWWLKLWAWAGVRNPYQRQMSRKEVVAHNEAFLHDHTTYPTRRQTHEAFLRAFSEVRFCDREMIVYGSRRARRLAPLLDRVPAVAAVYGSLAMSSVLAWGPTGPRAIRKPGEA
jgi:SAM-dependent methyltransferase